MVSTELVEKKLCSSFSPLCVIELLELEALSNKRRTATPIPKSTVPRSRGPDLTASVTF